MATYSRGFDTFDAVGGGISAGNLTLRNSTVSNNGAIAATGALDDGGGVSIDGALTLANSIIAGNTIGDAATPNDVSLGSASTLVLEGGNLVEDGSVTGAGVLNEDPKLGPLANNGGLTLTQALLSSSPAIDAGDNDAAVDDEGAPLTTDQRGDGFPRIVDGDGDGTATVDLGAFEAGEGELNLVEGTDGLDRLIGTDGPDLILAFAGNDVIDAGDGPDVIRPGLGRDQVRTRFRTAPVQSSLSGETGRTPCAPSLRYRARMPRRRSIHPSSSRATSP